MCVDRRTFSIRYRLHSATLFQLSTATYRSLVPHSGPIPNDSRYAALTDNFSAALCYTSALLYALRFVVPGQRARYPRCRKVGTLFERRENIS